MKRKIQIIPSGIPLVDNAWGGLYRGGTYILIGQHKSGRTLLGIQYAKECAIQKEVCLYFTTMRPKDLMINAASIDFDLQHYMDQNLIIVVRVSVPETAEKENNDNYLSEYLKDISNLVDQYKPNKIIFDELTPFIEFENVNYLKNIFLQAAENIEENDTTSLFILSDPTASHTKNIVNAISSVSTGVIYLQKDEDESGPNGGVMTIIPNVGHTEGQFSSNYFLEPNKGIFSQQDIPQSKKEEIKKENIKYKSLSEIELPEENYYFYNFYTFEEFTLVLENQIAVYKTTEQKFSVVSLKLDLEAERLGILNIEQLKNSVRLSIDKKDKISLIDNNILVLLTKVEEDSVNILLGRLKANLPGNNPDYVEKVIKFISVYQVAADENIENADDIINKLLFDGKKKKNKILFS